MQIDSDSVSTSHGTPPTVTSQQGPLLQIISPSTIRRPSDLGPSLTTSTLRGVPIKVDLASMPDGWAKVKHPDAGAYYTHEDKGVSTVCNILDTRTYALLTWAIETLHASQALKNLLDEQAVDLVLDVQQNKVCYYCVSHVPARRVFWLEDVGHAEVPVVPCTSIKCAQFTGSKVHCIEAQYWKHCELFPTTFTVTKGITGELKGILLQAAADRLLVKFSTSPFGKEALESMLNVVKEIESDIQEGSGHAAWIIARFMALHNDGVLQSSYGQIDDYFDIEDTRPSIGPYKRPFLLIILKPVLLKYPEIFAEELHSFHENFTLERWRGFVSKVNSSIRDSNLLATVLLSTNMGLLTWSDGGRIGGINNPTTVQIVAYISIICSVVSITVGLTIFRQYHSKHADTPLRAVVVLRRILREPFGLERLAIICSLPYVLLIWGLRAFLTAFGILFDQNTPTYVYIPVSVVLFFVVLCCIFCSYTIGSLKGEQKGSEAPRVEQDVKV